MTKTTGPDKTSFEGNVAPPRALVGFAGEVICACLQQKFWPGLMDWRLVGVPTGFPHSARTGGGGGKSD